MVPRHSLERTHLAKHDGSTTEWLLCSFIDMIRLEFSVTNGYTILATWLHSYSTSIVQCLNACYDYNTSKWSVQMLSNFEFYISITHALG